MNKYYKFWENNAKKYARSPVFEQVLSFFEGKTLNILEIGCSRRLEIEGNNDFIRGDGGSSFFWADYVNKFDGSLQIVDVSEEALNNCKTLLSDFIPNSNISFFYGDGKNYINESFDLIFLDGSDSPVEALIQFNKINSQNTSVLLDDFHTKGRIIKQNNKNAIIFRVNQEGHEMGFYPSQNLIDISTELKNFLEKHSILKC